MSAAVRKSVRACDRCSLRDTCRKPVPITGPTPATYLVVGEAPGAEEDRKGKVFVGQSGSLLRSAITEAKINLKRVAFCNVVSCRPPNNRTPTPAEIELCRPNLRLQIAAARPQVVIVCGATALKVFQPRFQITYDRGRPWAETTSREVKRVFIPTWHPAYVLRKRTTAAYEELVEDFKQARWRVKAKQTGGDWLGKWPENCRVCGAPVDRYGKDGTAYCVAHVKGDAGVVRQMVMAEVL